MVTANNFNLFRGDIHHSERRTSSHFALMYSLTDASPEVEAYAAHLTHSLNDLVLDEAAEPGVRSHLGDEDSTTEAHSLWLIDDSEAERQQAEQLLTHPATWQSEEQAPEAILVARRMVWPPVHLLLVVRGTASDHRAAEWVVRLATEHAGHVTVLTLLSPETTRELHVRPRLADSLSAGTEAGQQIRQVVLKLVAEQLPSVLKMRPGSLEQQIRRELTAGTHDLVVLALPLHHLWSTPFQDVVRTLLRGSHHSLLIVNSATQPEKR